MSDLRTVPFQAEHYPVVCDWWTRHKFGVIPAALLPTRGLVVQLDDVLVCAGFLYSTDSGMGWIEFVVASPDVKKRVVSMCLDQLLCDLVELSKEIGQRCLFTSSNLKGLIKRFERVGFQIGDTETTQLIRANPCQP